MDEEQKKRLLRERLFDEALAEIRDKVSGAVASFHENLLTREVPENLAGDLTVAFQNKLMDMYKLAVQVHILRSPPEA